MSTVMDPYAALELEPGCSDGDVQKAYERAKKHLGPDSLATYALVEPDEARAMLARLEEAFRLIGNPEQRRLYDQGRPGATDAREAEPSKEAPVEAKEPPKTEKAAKEAAEEAAQPKAEAAKVEAVAPVAAPAPAPAPTPTAIPSPTADAEPAKPVRKTEADIPPDAPVTGEALKKVREARGLTLKELEGKTKIGHWHLKNIEEERYKDLPALVYLRGFLMSLARELKLDPIRVSRSYLEQMAKVASAKAEEK
jgi:curved DNA-binding protein CbpA